MKKVFLRISRNHPGGILARIKWLRWILGYGLLTSLLLFIFSVFILFTQEPLTIPIKLYEKGVEGLRIEEQFGLLPGLKGDLLVDAPTVWDRILLNHPTNPVGWAGALFRLMICWFLLRILNELDVQNPFRFSISKFINKIAIILFMFPLFMMIRMAYSFVVISRLDANGMPDTDLLLSGFSGYMLLALMLTVIAYVYRIGCRIQADQELTI